MDPERKWVFSKKKSAPEAFGAPRNNKNVGSSRKINPLHPEMTRIKYPFRRPLPCLPITWLNLPHAQFMLSSLELICANHIRFRSCIGRRSVVCGFWNPQMCLSLVFLIRFPEDSSCPFLRFRWVFFFKYPLHLDAWIKYLTQFNYTLYCALFSFPGRLKLLFF